MEPGQILDEWEKSKRPRSARVIGACRRTKTYPSLLKAQRIQQRAASLGFDWDRIESVFDKLKEEIAEFEEASRTRARPESPTSWGHPVCTGQCRQIPRYKRRGCPTGTISKFTYRFAHVERKSPSGQDDLGRDGRHLGQGQAAASYLPIASLREDGRGDRRQDPPAHRYLPLR